MSKYKNIAWLVAILLLISHVLLDHLFITSSSSILVRVIDVCVQVLMLLGIGGAIASVISLVPYKKLKYSAKFNYIFPSAVALTAGFMNLFLLNFINQ